MKHASEEIKKESDKITILTVEQSEIIVKDIEKYIKDLEEGGQDQK